MRDPVKGKTEAGRRREMRARQTRERIVAAAQGLFVERGYVATTIEAIAGAAGVAPATVYQAFGTKPALLAAVLDVSVAGDAETVPLLERDWVATARADPDPRRRLAVVVRHAAEVAARSAPIKVVMRDAAAVEPAVRDLIREDHERRRVTQHGLVEVVLADVQPRGGFRREQASDMFFALVNSDAYQLAHDLLGWAVDDWQRWLVMILDRQFFDDAPYGPRQTRSRLSRSRNAAAGER
jgi:AcrR family transcriptional regulator